MKDIYKIDYKEISELYFSTSNQRLFKRNYWRWWKICKNS